MSLKDKLPVSYLLFTKRGRINRLTYWLASLFIWSSFYVLFNLFAFLFNYHSTLLLYPLLFWALFCTATKRLHDLDRSGAWLWLIALPVLGPLALIYLLGFRRGNAGSNRYGAVPGSNPDYFKNPDAEKIPNLPTEQRIVNDVTQLNPVIVAKVKAPRSIEELQTLIKENPQPICIGGGRFSMGGQTASPDALHIDMRKLNQVLEFSPQNKTIKVQAGIRWCDIQKLIDEHNLSVKIMQTYANFTVGGSLSVNCHGRYIGLGPLILSVRSLDVILPNGEMVHCSPSEKPELFYACVGCYNAIAIIAHAELDLTDNCAVQRQHSKMKRSAYKDFFFEHVRGNKEVIFHNGDIYPPYYRNVRAVSWVQTSKKPNVKTRLMPLASAYPLERYFIGAFAKSKLGKWRREYIIDPIVFSRRKIHWRNYEAGYDVLELEPESRRESTYVLQEYFAPVERFDEFSEKMAETFMRHSANIINVSIRHALPDSGSLLAWAPQEMFAFVVWYKQNTDDIEKGKVAVWTRELIDAALSVSGAYYLPYQPHATQEQFHAAYPGAQRLFELKKQHDPHYRFRNVLWDKYYSQWLK